jgi:hypothetical protein
MGKGQRQLDRWWNAVVEIWIPFDTPEEAREAFTDDDTLDRLFEIFGENTVIGGRIEEAVEDEDLS